jgi:RimJ/RimL family protein N-acetyltransferase
MPTIITQTERLILRTWSKEDIAPFAAMCADNEVMRYFPATLSFQETENLVNRFQERYEQDGYTYYVVEIKETGEFIGFCGMLMQTYESPFTPNVDIGWRLKKAAWGKGYATEAARACLVLAKETLGLKTIISVASQNNTPSINVMQKIGMEKVGEFEHPALKDTPELNPCLVYKISLS